MVIRPKAKATFELLKIPRKEASCLTGVADRRAMVLASLFCFASKYAEAQTISPHINEFLREHQNGVFRLSGRG